MKKLSIILTLALSAVAFGDIQAPPASHQTRVHKFGRGLSNTLYGLSELPFTMVRVNDRAGGTAQWGNGIVEGLHRSFVRIGSGVFDMVSFPVRTHKDSFRSCIQNIQYDPYNGYSEFPPELGWQSNYDYARRQPL